MREFDLETDRFGLYLLAGGGMGTVIDKATGKPAELLGLHARAFAELQGLLRRAFVLMEKESV